MKEAPLKTQATQRKTETHLGPMQAKQPPAFGLQAAPLQRLDQDPRGRIACTQFGDYFVVPDKTPVCYVNVPAEQITESEFKILQETYASIKEGTGDLQISEIDDEAKEHAGFKSMILRQIGRLMSKPTGRRLILGLVKGGKPVTIKPSSTSVIAYASTKKSESALKEDGSKNEGGDTTIFIDDNLTDDQVKVKNSEGKDIPSPVFVILGHELIHARHNQAGENRTYVNAENQGYGNREEELTIVAGDLTENEIRREHGVPLRHGHSSGGN
jgi:hypothetical protein